MYTGVANTYGAPARRTTVAGASPATYTNTNTVPERIILSGGTVTLVEAQADLVNFDVLGVVAGWFLLNPGESLRITWAASAPTLIICPF